MSMFRNPEGDPSNSDRIYVNLSFFLKKTESYPVEIDLSPGNDLKTVL